MEQEKKEESTTVLDEELKREDENNCNDECCSKKGKKEKYNKKTGDLEKEIFELKDKLLRNSAELANFKRRINDERITDRKYGSIDLVSDLINQLENLRIVCNMPTDNEVLKNFLIGFKMINDQMFDVLKRDGLQDIKTMNEKFDPKFHKAIEIVACEDKEENICIEEIQRGYMYKDRVLRCASVKVSKKLGDELPEKQENDEIKEN